MSAPVRVTLHFPTGEAEFNAFLQEFQGESDRAAAVLAAAYLDEQLKDLLTAAFTVDSKGAELLDVNQPLGSFGPRIAISEAVGLITAPERRDLDLLRKIRNDFAHKLHGMSFADQRVASRCAAFECIDDFLRTQVAVPVEYVSDPRSRFNLAASLLAWYIRLRVAAVKPFPAPRPPLWDNPMAPLDRPS